MINKISTLMQPKTLSQNEINYIMQKNIIPSQNTQTKEVQNNVQNNQKRIINALLKNNTSKEVLEKVADNKDYLYARINDQINFNKKNEEAKIDKKSFCGFFRNLFTKKSRNKKYKNLHNRLESIKNDPQKLANMYKEICGQKIDLAELESVEKSKELVKNSTPAQKEAIKKSLNDEIKALESSVKTQVKKQGNFTWLVGKIRNGFGANATESKTMNMIKVLKNEIKSLSELIDNGKAADFCAKYKTITGKTFDFSNKKVFKNSEATNSTAKFLKQNKTAANVITTVATTAAGVAISVASMGTATGIAAGIVGSAVLSAGVGALTKIQADGGYEIKNKNKATGSFFKDLVIDLGFSVLTLNTAKTAKLVAAAKDTVKGVCKIGLFHSARRIKDEVETRKEKKNAVNYNKILQALENRKKARVA